MEAAAASGLPGFSSDVHRGPKRDGAAADEKEFPVTALIQELFQVGLYKRSQGRITRQVTCGALGLAVALGLYRLYTMLVQYNPWLHFGVPFVLLLVLGWVAYRVVNVPAFADFLIAVEAEMNKVSWPTRHELWRASLVVLFTIFSLAVVLFFFDAVWQKLFTFFQVITTAS
jgi:preprotein translocase subunit SecE